MSRALEFLPFSKPHLSKETIAEVVSCLESGWIATGPRVQQLEEDLKVYCKAPYAPLLTSATAGIFLALKGMGVGEGDEVITTTMTFVSTANAIVHTGARPVLVDCDEGTRTMDLSLLEEAITPRTKAIIPVHFGGLPVDLDPLYEIAKKYSIRVLEDAAPAIGSFYKGRPIGSFGDTQVFSFHPCKNMTTGEGGCVTTRDEALASFIKRGRFHGIDRDAWNRYAKGGSLHFDVVDAGYKYNMSDLQASIGLHQLKELDENNRRREFLVNRYFESFKDWDALSLPVIPEYDHFNSWHIFTVLINEVSGVTRDQFIERMKEENIGTGFHYAPLHLFDFYQKAYGYKVGDFPVAERVGSQIVSIPLFPGMTELDQDRVIEAMKKILKRV